MTEQQSERLLLKLTPLEKRAWTAVAGLASIEDGRPINTTRFIRETVNERAAFVLAEAIQSGRIKGMAARELRRYLDGQADA